MKNKKAATSISILALVMMALVLCGAALTAFLLSKPLEKTIPNARFIENIYVEELQINFLLKNAGEKAIAETKPFDLGLFKENFKAEVNKLTDDENTKNIKNIISNENYLLEDKGGKISITIPGFQITGKWLTNDKQDIEAVYKTDIKIELAKENI